MVAALKAALEHSLGLLQNGTSGRLELTKTRRRLMRLSPNARKPKPIKISQEPMKSEMNWPHKALRSMTHAGRYNLAENLI